MSIITAYKSDEDGVIFEHKADYLKHLRVLASEKKAQKKRQIKINAFETKREEMFSCKTITELQNWINDNLSFFENNPYNRDNKKIKIKKIILSDIIIEGFVSNYHCAPIGKKTNWGNKDENEPTGYPGFRGKIKIEYISEPSFGLSSILENTGINSGSGGASYGYELNLFALDFKQLYFNFAIKQMKLKAFSISDKTSIIKGMFKYKIYEDKENLFLNFCKEQLGENSKLFLEINTIINKENLESKLNETVEILQDKKNKIKI